MKIAAYTKLYISRNSYQLTYTCKVPCNTPVILGLSNIVVSCYIIDSTHCNGVHHNKQSVKKTGA